MGADFKTSGAFQEWIRPETTYFMWRAFLATREPRYLQSMLRHATWMQYKQWDEFDLESANSMRTFGGSDESFQVGNDNLNGAPPPASAAPSAHVLARAPRRAVTAPLCAGFGANFWGETVGQGIALLEYYRALEAGEVSL